MTSSKRNKAEHTLTHDEGHTRVTNISVGDTVLVKQKKRNKFSTNFSPTPYTVVRVKESKIVARNGTHYITSNATFFKKIRGREESKEDEIVIYQNDETPRQQQQQQVVQPRRSTRNRVQKVYLDINKLFSNPLENWEHSNFI